MFYPKYDQYILWQYEPNPPKKPSKVPCDATGKRINPHDPFNWLSEAAARDAAQRLGLQVGFVLSKDADQYFCIDLDGVRDLQTGNVTDPEADALLKEFPGASIEVSVSGTGFHIWGSAEHAAQYPAEFALC